jgi:hypothetical protein
MPTQPSSSNAGDGGAPARQVRAHGPLSVVFFGLILIGVAVVVVTSMTRRSENSVWLLNKDVAAHHILTAGDVKLSAEDVSDHGEFASFVVGRMTLRSLRRCFER